MKFSSYIMILVCSICFSCNGKNNSAGIIPELKPFNEIVNASGNTVLERFNPPNGFVRMPVKENSFEEYLRNLELKPFGSHVLYYNNMPKLKEDVYISVVYMDIDHVDLQQCADAVMRLKAEYLFKEKRYREIHFNLLSDGKPRYFLDYSKGDTTYTMFRKYMRYIFAYANTGSLHDELIQVDKIEDMKIGDVFIQKKQPYGHAVIVIDVAENKSTGKKVYMLAQSYMPAQETQVLINPSNSNISPWYEIGNSVVNTPQWTFIPEDLRRFRKNNP